MTDAFRRILDARRSIRQFLSQQVDRDVIVRVLEDAQQSPSNCNTQPWHAHVLSGHSLATFSDKIRQAWGTGALTPDFSFDQTAYPDPYSGRARAQGAAYYQALGIRREDYDERRVAGERNLTFFGAPHVALLFTPSVGDNVRIAADVGMYAQTFLLSLAANGLGGVPQTMLGFFGEEARAVCNERPASKLMFGISFGHPDRSHLAGAYKIGRADVVEAASFHD